MITIEAWTVLFAAGQIILAMTLVIVLTGIASYFLRRHPAARERLWRAALFGVLISPLVPWLDRALALDLLTLQLPGERSIVVADEPPSTAIPNTRVESPPLSPEPPTPVSSPRIEPLIMPPPVADVPARVPVETVPLPSSSADADRIESSTWDLGRITMLPAAVWILGCLWHAGRHIVGWFRCRTVLASAIPLDAMRFAAELRQTRDAIGVMPPVLVSPNVRGPCVVGVPRPRIVLPASMLDWAGSEELVQVLIHEAAHVVRRDPITNLLQAAARCLYWPHPLVHWLNRRLREAREEVCDNVVLAHARASSYAETLLRVAQRCRPPAASFAGLAMVPRRGSLEQRVGDLLDPQRNRATDWPWPRRLMVQAVLLGVLVLVGVVKFETDSARADEPASAPVVIEDPQDGDQSAPDGDGSVADIIAGQIIDQLAFASPEQRDQTYHQFHKLVSKYAPEKPSPEYIHSIRDSLDRRLSEEFPDQWVRGDPDVRDEYYIHLPGWFQMLQWRLFMALRREPLGEEERARLEEQHDWIRDHVRSLPQPPAKFARADRTVEAVINEFDAMVDDPLEPLFKEVLTDEQFALFQEKVRADNQSLGDKALLFALSHVVSADLLTRFENGSEIPQPDINSFGGPPVHISQANGHIELGFPKGAAFLGMHNSLDDYRETGQFIDLEETVPTLRAMDAPNAQSGTFTIEERDRRFAKWDRGNLIFDEQGMRLIGVRGTRLVPLEVVRFFEADRIPHEQLVQRLTENGSQFWTLPEEISRNVLDISPHDALAAVLTADGEVFLAQVRGHDPAGLSIHVRKHHPMTGDGPSVALAPANDSREKQRASEAKSNPKPTAKKGAIRLTGRVLRPDGSPAEDAEVFLLGPPNNGNSYSWPLPVEKTTTDTQGHYQFEVTTRGRHELWANLDNLTSRTGITDGKIIRISKSGEPPDPVELKLHRGVTVRVVIKDAATGKLMPDATVDLGWNDLLRDFETDESGVAVVQPLTAERWQLQVFADEHAKQWRWINLQSGKGAEMEFSLEPGATISGTVRDQAGEPIEGAGVRVQAEGAGSMEFEYVRTDQQGRYRVANMPLKQVEVSTSPDGYERDEITINRLTADRVVDITLSPRQYAGSIQGVVVDKNGKPISGATLLNQGQSTADERKAKTDEDGRFLLENLFAGSTGPSVIVSADGFAPERVRVEPGSSENPAEVKITLEPGHCIEGRVVDQEDKPIGGVIVYFAGGRYPFELGGSTKTNKQGRFSLDSLPPKSPFTFIKRGYSEIENRKLPLDGEEAVTVVMQSEGIIRGKVTDAKTGKPIPTFNVRITFSPQRKPDEPSTGLSGRLVDPGQTFQSEDGIFKLDELTAGMPLQVTVSAEGYERGVKERVVARTASEVEPAEFALNPVDPSTLTTYAGRLLGPDGKPVAGAAVRLIAAKERDPDDQYGSTFGWNSIETGHIESEPNVLRFAEAATDADGRFSFPKIPKSAEVELAWWGEGVAPGRRGQLETLDEQKRQSIEIRAEKPARIIVTVDRDAFPEAASLDFFRRRNDVYGYEIQRLEDGKASYEFNGLPEGTYAIHLRGPSEPVPGEPNAITSTTLARTEATVKAGETVEIKIDRSDMTSEEN